VSRNFILSHNSICSSLFNFSAASGVDTVLLIKNNLTITEIRGYRNRLPNNEEMEIVKKWASQNNVKINLFGLGFISNKPDEWMVENF
jgi:hypothetical protein